MYPGTFDPITRGHEDLVRRCVRLFDQVVVAIASNPKKAPLFTLDERVALAKEVLSDLPEVSVTGYTGLTVEFARANGFKAIIRGLRAISDFEYEFQLATMNRHLIDGVETVFLTPSEHHTFISSSLVREIAEFGGDVSAFVHPVVAERLKQKLGKQLMRAVRVAALASSSPRRSRRSRLGAGAAQPAAPARASTQLVVSANPHASEAGRTILRAGGSAVDAAIAVQLVLTLVEPQSSGIGGGAFMLVYAAPEDGDAGAVTAYEGRETAPAAATPDMFLGANGRPESFANVGVGGLAVGVPGALRMLELAHREHGRLPWADALRAGDRACRERLRGVAALVRAIERLQAVRARRRFSPLLLRRER